MPVQSINSQPIHAMKKSHLLLSAILVFSGATIAAFGASSSGLQRAGGPPPRGGGHFHHPGPRPAPPPRYHRPVPVYHGGYYARPWRPSWARYYPGYYWGTGYWGPSYGVSMVYDMGNSNPYDDGTHAAAGAVIGGVAGAIIGNNSGSHHNGWNSWSGAVVGAGLGAIVGSIADNNVARGRQQQAARQQLTEQQVQQAERARQTAPAAGQAPQNVTIINNYYGGASSMSPANSLFGR